MPAFVVVCAVLVVVAVVVGRRTRVEPERRCARRARGIRLRSRRSRREQPCSRSRSSARSRSRRRGSVSYRDSCGRLDFWIPKAQTIYYTGGLDAGLWGSLTHPEYPPLLPAMNAATFHFVGGFHPSVLPFQLALLGVAFLLAALTLLDRFTPRWISLPALALLATTPWFWWRLQSPLADQTLAYLITASARSCSCSGSYDGRPPGSRWPASFLVAASLTKLEGAMLERAPARRVPRRSGCSGTAAPRSRRRWLLLAPAAILPWRLLAASNDLPDLGRSTTT